MKQYIDKDALLAEIERRLEALANTSAGDNREFAAIIGAQYYELKNLIQFINTLEVKKLTLLMPLLKRLKISWKCQDMDLQSLII